METKTNLEQIARPDRHPLKHDVGVKAGGPRYGAAPGSALAVQWTGHRTVRCSLWPVCNWAAGVGGLRCGKRPKRGANGGARRVGSNRTPRDMTQPTHPAFGVGAESPTPRLQNGDFTTGRPSFIPSSVFSSSSVSDLGFVSPTRFSQASLRPRHIAPDISSSLTSRKRLQSKTKRPRIPVDTGTSLEKKHPNPGRRDASTQASGSHQAPIALSFQPCGLRPSACLTLKRGSQTSRCRILHKRPGCPPAGRGPSTGHY